MADVASLHTTESRLNLVEGRLGLMETRVEETTKGVTTLRIQLAEAVCEITSLKKMVRVTMRKLNSVLRTWSVKNVLHTSLALLQVMLAAATLWTMIKMISVK